MRRGITALLHGVYKLRQKTLLEIEAKGKGKADCAYDSDDEVFFIDPVDVTLDELRIEPHVLESYRDVYAPAAKVETVPDTTPGDGWKDKARADVDHDEKLAALFDPVPVAALEKMFPVNGKWNSWAERAHRNGLKLARESRGKFNPYRAAIWFMNQGMQGWDLARCKRKLANNLPSRSQDYIHLLTDDIADL